MLLCGVEVSGVCTVSGDVDLSNCCYHAVHLFMLCACGVEINALFVMYRALLKVYQEL